MKKRKIDFSIDEIFVSEFLYNILLKNPTICYKIISKIVFQKNKIKKYITNCKKLFRVSILKMTKNLEKALYTYLKRLEGGKDVSKYSR